MNTNGTEHTSVIQKELYIEIERGKKRDICQKATSAQKEASLENTIIIVILHLSCQGNVERLKIDEIFYHLINSLHLSVLIMKLMKFYFCTDKGKNYSAAK